MAGALTEHACYRLAQLRGIAGEATDELATAQKALDEATERYATWPDSWSAVQLQRESVQKAEAKKQGADQILQRFEAKMRDPAYQQLLKEADEWEEKTAALDFAVAFQPVGARVEKTATELAGLISEAMRVVDEHVKTQIELQLSAERVGFGELYRRPPLAIETGLARVREAIERALRASPVSDFLIRGATGIRL